ncbi:MAG: hypothetical protein V7K89_35215 [Nostoc sp.]|uniref:hypothetical protein n=1 Tax=Nostoc sp. TaxID=1180 RepID=UPI002FF7722A
MAEIVRLAIAFVKLNNCGNASTFTKNKAMPTATRSRSVSDRRSGNASIGGTFFYLSVPKYDHNN